MILLFALVGLVVYVILRLQMIQLEITWLRKYIMRLLTTEISQKANSQIPEARQHVEPDEYPLEEIDEDDSPDEHSDEVELEENTHPAAADAITD